MFVRNSIKTVTFAAAVALLASPAVSPALADDGSVRVMQSLSEKVEQAQNDRSATPGQVQFAIAGATDAPAAERSGPQQDEFAHESWRDLPPRR